MPCKRPAAGLPGSREHLSLCSDTQRCLFPPPFPFLRSHIHPALPPAPLPAAPPAVQYGEHRVPHPRAPGGSILLINSAAYYVQKPEHAAKVQPRVVALPEVKVVAQGA